MKNMNKIRDEVGKVWTDTDIKMETDLRLGDVEQRLRQGRHEIANMIILVRRRRCHFGYAMIALRRGRSSGFQRYLYCTLSPTEKGTAIEGVMRIRLPTRWFMNIALSFLALIFSISVATAFSGLIQGSLDDPLIFAIRGVAPILMAAFGLGLAYFGMSATESNERCLEDWLKRTIS